MLCEIAGLEVSPGVCKLRHAHAKAKKRLKNKWSACLFCPEIFKEDDMGGGYVEGVCGSCGKERNLLKNKMVCQSCLQQARGDQTAMTKTALPRKKVDVVAELPKKTPAIWEEPEKRLRHLFLDFDTRSDLYDQIEKQAHEQFRSPEQQALFLINKAVGA